MEDIIVAVIGGSGFIGQHIVKELQRWQREREDEEVEISKNKMTESTNETEEDRPIREKNGRRIKEILVLDKKSFKPVVDIKDHPIVKFRKCDIRFQDQLHAEMKGVTAVIHCADVKPSFNEKVSPEKDSLWVTNVEGTDNVIEACKKANVKALIYTSSVATVMSGNKIVCHSESLTPKVEENKLILGSFAKSKIRAEKAVAGAHRTSTANGGTLSTIILRPTAMYGEGDSKFIPFFIRMAQAAGGKLPAIGSPFAYFQLTYAGNAAAAHITALMHLLDGNHLPLQDCGGLPVYITDGSLPGLSSDVLNHFLTPCGLVAKEPSRFLFITIFISMLLSLWFAICEKMGKQSRWVRSTPSTLIHRLAGTTTIPGNLRAELSLNFKPKFSWEEAKDASVAYYKTYQVKR